MEFAHAHIFPRPALAARLPPAPIRCHHDCCPRSDPCRSAAAAAADSSPTAAAGPEPAAAPSESLGERRAQALRGMFPMLFSMYARRSELWQAIAVERYLSQAANVADLEHRIREVGGPSTVPMGRVTAGRSARELTDRKCRGHSPKPGDQWAVRSLHYSNRRPPLERGQSRIAILSIRNLYFICDRNGIIMTLLQRTQFGQLG